MEFDNPEDAASAYDKLQNTEIDGRQVFLDFASPSKSHGYLCVFKFSLLVKSS